MPRASRIDPERRLNFSSHRFGSYPRPIRSSHTGGTVPIIDATKRGSALQSQRCPLRAEISALETGGPDPPFRQDGQEPGRLEGRFRRRHPSGLDLTAGGEEAGDDQWRGLQIGEVVDDAGWATRSSCWPRRTRSSRKAPTPCPRPSKTASCSRCSSSTPPSRTSSRSPGERRPWPPRRRICRPSRLRPGRTRRRQRSPAT